MNEIEKKKVHIIISKDVLKNPHTLNELIRKLQEEFQLQDINASRIHRLGVVTGSMPIEQISKLRDSLLVESVESDNTRNGLLSV